MIKPYQINLHFTDKTETMTIELKSTSSKISEISLPQMITPENYSGKLERIEYVYDDGNPESNGCKEVILKDKEEINNQIEQWKNYGTIDYKTVKCNIPTMDYSDITNKRLLGSDIILDENLAAKDGGLLAFSGKRNIEIKLNNFDDFFKGYSIYKQRSIRINFKKINDDSFDYQNLSTPPMSLSVDDIKENMIVELDTNFLGRQIFDVEKYREFKALQLGGDVEISFADESEEVVFKFPLCITLRNTYPDVCDLISEEPASIDFGTSSTCVAIRGENGQPELLTISSEDSRGKKYNKYENPTNIMLFRWDSLYREWKLENNFPPVMKKGSIGDHNSGKNPDFDFGYSVKNILGETSKAEINAILTLIKMIPYDVVVKGSQINLNPFSIEERNKYIYIVTDPEEQDENHLDPVAFYGYLIGSAINDLSKRNKIYNKFQITSPSKFSAEIKKKIKKSLEYGLKRSLPLPLRSKISTEMEYYEPVAYIGAVCGTNYFRVGESESKMFAVYDFGGGTLDFSYGIVTNNSEEETSINILGVSGDENIGGEKLIEKISFIIYENNKEEMIESDIPITLPYNSELPDEIPERLVTPSNYARANMNTISEHISRGCFEGEADTDKTAVECTLFKATGEGVNTTLIVNYDDIFDELHNIISKTIDMFANEMDSAFRDTAGYKREDVYIFKAGNSSKNRFVEQLMNKKFNKDKICMIDQIKAGTARNMRYAITPKTAVAFGRLKLNNFEVIMPEFMFRYYVGYINEGSGMFKTCIEKNSGDKSWHKLKKITGNIVDLYYTEAKTNDADAEGFKRVPLNTEGRRGEFVYLRIADEITIEYCISGTVPESDFPQSKIYSKRLL